MRSPETISDYRRAPWRPLLVKEVREVVSGRALWIMILILCPLVGYSFFQAVSLYGEASAAVLQSPVLATGLSPLDGVLVPTFGSFYVAVTLLFPFVAIRVLGREKESGALRLLVQLPYGTPTLIATKLVAVMAAWGLAFVPVVVQPRHLEDGRRPSARARNPQSHVRTCALRPAGRRNRGFRCRHIGGRRDRRDHRAGLHDRFLGAGFHRGGPAGIFRLAVAAVVDADAAYLRAGTVLGRSGDRDDDRHRGFCGARRHLAAARSVAAPQDAAIARLRGGDGRDRYGGGAGPLVDRRHGGSPQLVSAGGRARAAATAGRRSSSRSILRRRTRATPTCGAMSCPSWSARCPMSTIRLAGAQQSVIGSAGDDALWRSRIRLRRPYRHEPIDRPSRNPASALRPCRHRAAVAGSGRRLRRLIRWWRTRRRRCSGSSARFRCRSSFAWWWSRRPPRINYPARRNGGQT